MRSKSRLKTFIATLSLLGPCAFSQSAFAGGVDGRTGQRPAVDVTTDAPGSDGRRGGGDPCTYERASARGGTSEDVKLPEEEVEARRAAQDAERPLKSITNVGLERTLFVKWCPYEVDGEKRLALIGDVWLVENSPNNIAVGLYSRGETELPMPLPTIDPFNTGDGKQWMYARMWTSITLLDGEWNPPPAVASAGGITVTMTPKLETITFYYGDKTEPVTCSAFTKKLDCQIRYDDSSKNQPDYAYYASVVLRWSFTFTVTGGPAVSRTFPDYDLATNFRLRVATISTWVTQDSTSVEDIPPPTTTNR
jgi:hypothetical protein